MTPHIPTLVMATVFVSAILGALLLGTWLQDRNMRALPWWGATCMLAAIGFALLGLRGIVADFLSIEIANAALLVAAGAMLCGANAFEGRRLRLRWLLAPALMWIAICQLPFFATDMRARMVVMSSFLAAYFCAAALVFWRARAEHLVSRWTVIALLALHAAFHVLRVPAVYLTPPPSVSQLGQSGHVGVLAVCLLLFMVTFAFTLLALAKERAELGHKLAARTDPLTGLLNRRALFDAAARVSGARRFDTASMLVFDLDSFKQINDRFGHPVGDRVLQLFAATAQAELRSGDLLGRLGGEEFAAFLPECNEADAIRTGERIRMRFAEAARALEPGRLGATVSVGVAVGAGATAAIDPLIAEADRALYRAKASGRDCVRFAEPKASTTLADIKASDGNNPMLNPTRAAAA